MKRAMITLAAVLMWGAISSTAEAQTPAQMAKFCRYLSKHPATTMELAAANGMDGPEFLTSYCAAAYENQYARLQSFLMTHPELAQQLADEQTLGGVSPYQGVAPYPSAGLRPTRRRCPINPFRLTRLLRPINPFHFRMERCRLINPPTQVRIISEPLPTPIGQSLATAITGLVGRLLGNNPACRI